MVVRGIRKHLNNDPEAQKASVEAAERQRLAALDELRHRYSVCWYDAKDGVWAEVEAISLEFDRPMVREVRFTFHAVKPVRKVSSLGLRIRDTGEFFEFESGFVADGLNHAVWISGGNWMHNRCFRELRQEFNRNESKYKIHAQLVTSISPLPSLFWELYRLRISIPQIQEAYNQYLNDVEG
jgi:hypothetical protein